VRFIGLLIHTCAYSIEQNSIGTEGAQHIAAALAHNSTLQTLRSVQYITCSHEGVALGALVHGTYYCVVHWNEGR
jgi:hypothetical protein